MEVWCATDKPDQPNPPYSGASNIQVGPYQASSKDLSVIATDSMASANTHEMEVATGVSLINVEKYWC